MKASIRFALVATTALGWVSPALAQQAGNESAGDIVVTARRVEERLQDVPISITVFNQQQLTNRNVTNAQDLASFTPSLSVTTGFGTENTTYALRGFVQETGTAPSVGVYFGDVVAPRGPSQGFPAGDGAGPGMFFDLQNVQVLKGPQGTLFGRNTTGGAVLLVPQRPTDKLEGYVEGSIGNYDMRRVQAVLNVPLADTLRVRLGVDHQKRAGFMKNVTNIGPRDFDDTNYVALRASVVWDVTPDIENYTIGSWINSDNNGHLAKAVAAAPSLDPFGGLLAFQALGSVAKQNAVGFNAVTNDMPDPYQKMRTWQVINNTKWQVNDNLTVRNIVSYAQLWTKTHTSLFGTQLFVPANAFGPGVPAAATPFNFAVIRNLPGGYSSNQRTFTEEFRLEGNAMGGKLTYQTGVYYENSTPRGFIGSQSATFLGCSNPDALICSAVIPGAAGMNYTAAKNAFRSTGIYAQGTYALTEQLKLTGGLRYTWDHVNSVSRRITYAFTPFLPNSGPLSPIVPFSAATAALMPFVTHCTDFTVRTPPLCELSESKSWSAPTWTLGLDYKPTEDMLLYAKWSRGYRTGNIKSDVPIEFHIFNPEHVDTYEIGTKTSFTGALRGYFNISAFYNNFRNQQIQQGFNINNCRYTGPLVLDASGRCVPNLPTISVPGNAGPINIGKSRIWGFEVDGRINLFEGFSVDANYTYLNTKITKITPATLPTDNVYIVNPTAAVGDPLILSPKHKLSLGANYTLPLLESVGEISLGGSMTYQSSSIANYTTLRNPNIVNLTGGFDTARLPARTLLNLNLNWNKVGGGPVDFALFATNVTNKHYYSSINGLIAGLGIETATVGEPRMFGARVRFSFGGE